MLAKLAQLRPRVPRPFNGHLEEVMPHVASEDWVVVADDRGMEPVKMHNSIEEGVGDRGN